MPRGRLLAGRIKFDDSIASFDFWYTIRPEISRSINPFIVEVDSFWVIIKSPCDGLGLTEIVDDSSISWIPTYDTTIVLVIVSELQGLVATRLIW